MVTKILTTISVAKKWAKKSGVVYRSPRIYLPTKLTDDSSFPFLEGDQVAVRVDGDRLVVERLKEVRGNVGDGARRRRSKKRVMGRSRSRKGRRAERHRRQGLRRVGVPTRL